MVTDLGQPGYRGRLSENAATIAEVLKPAGYRTFMSGKWHVGTNDPTLHGFEQFYGTLISAATFWDPAGYLRRPQGSRTRSYDKDAFYGTDALTDYALDFLDGRAPDSGSAVVPVPRVQRTALSRCTRGARISRSTGTGTRWDGTS